MSAFFLGVFMFNKCENKEIGVLFCNVSDYFVNKYLNIFFNILFKRDTTYQDKWYNGCNVNCNSSIYQTTLKERELIE